MEVTCMVGTSYFNTDSIILPKLGSPVRLGPWQFLLAGLWSSVGHPLASGCSHPDRGYLPTHGECDRMAGAFPTQGPKAELTIWSHLAREDSSWGGWGSSLKKSCRVEESEQFSKENWAPKCIRRSRICSLLSYKEYENTHKFILINTH